MDLRSLCQKFIAVLVVVFWPSFCYGQNLITNGSFDTGIQGWTDVSWGTGHLSWEFQALVLLGGGSNNRAMAQQQILTEAGKIYEFSVNKGNTNQIYLRVGTGSDAGPTSTESYNLLNASLTGSGVVTAQFTATGPVTYITIHSFINTDAIYLDDISVYGENEEPEEPAQPPPGDDGNGGDEESGGDEEGGEEDGGTEEEGEEEETG